MKSVQVHQPSAELFEQFDTLLLMQKGGETVYCGELGLSSSILLEYFVSNGAPAATHQNPADYMLEQVCTKPLLPSVQLVTACCSSTQPPPEPMTMMFHRVVMTRRTTISLECRCFVVCHCLVPSHCPLSHRLALV